VVLFTIPSYAQLDRTKLPAAGPAPEVKIGDYDSFTLPNGLKVFVVENHKLPRVTFSLILDVDPVLEGKDAGYVSAAGDLLRYGTQKRTKDKLDQEVDFLGASLNTSSTGVSASGLAKYKDKLLDIMSDVVMNSNFTQESLDKIKKEMLSSLAVSKEEPNSIAQRVRAALMFGKETPYGEQETDETVKAFTLDMCKQYYQAYFKPNVAYLAVVGDVNKKQIKPLVEKYFGKWQKGDVPKNTFQFPKAPLINKVCLVDRENSVQSVISVCYPVDLKIGNEDAIKAGVMNLILGGSSTGRLFMDLREEKAYTYGAYSSLNPDRLQGSFLAFTSVRNAVTDSAITEVMKQLKEIRAGKVTEAELDRAKNYLTGSFIRGLESPETVARFALNIARYNLSKDYYKNYLKNLSAVTVDDVLEMAKKYIKPNNAYILVVGKGADIAKNISNFTVTGKVDYYDIYGEKYDPNVKKVPEGVTVDQVLNKYVEALGGKNNLLKINDESMKMTGAMQGMNITITMSRKAPNKFYQLVDFGVGQQKTIFDGTKGKTSAMGQEQDLSGDQLESIKLEAEMNAFLDYPKYGIKPELTGSETINNKDAYKVVLNMPTGKKTTQYYDINSGLLIRQISTAETQQGSFTSTIDFDDYKDVNGVKVPYKLTQSTPMGSIELTVSDVEINKGIADSLFEVK
jgi:predicted Zn-dependent peptidase